MYHEAAQLPGARRVKPKNKIKLLTLIQSGFSLPNREILQGILHRRGSKYLGPAEQVTSTDHCHHGCSIGESTNSRYFDSVFIKDLPNFDQFQIPRQYVDIGVSCPTYRKRIVVVIF